MPRLETLLAGDSPRAHASTSLPITALAAARFLGAYGFLPNFVFALLGHWLYLMRPAFNLDYLLLGALPLGKRTRGVAFALVFANDLLINAAPAFHFALPAFLRSLRHLDAIEPRAVVAGAIAVTGVSVAIAAMAVAMAGAASLPRLALGMMVLLAGADVLNGTSFVPLPGARPFLDFNIANSGMRKTLLALRSLVAPTPSSPMPLASLDSATGPLLARVRDSRQALPPRNEALVIVESLGLFRDPATAALLLRPLTELGGRYDASVGAVPFRGATLNGELRELCGLRAEGVDGLPDDCLPAALAQRGFRTTALHGFTREFYDRASWYPQTGFQQTLFAEDLREAGLSRSCGSGFRGLCDADVATRLLHELQASRDGTPRFAYWMTLNSHLPETSAVGEGATFDCTLNALTRANPTLCLHARALSAALVAVAAVASNPTLPPTDFIVVGDHAPPFWDRSDREAFDEERVPFVRLAWRD